MNLEYLEFFSTILMGWLWLDMGKEAQEALNDGNQEYSSAFYESKLHSMRFFFKYELPKTSGLAEILMDKESLTIGSDNKVFQ